MAHKKGQGSVRNGRDSKSKRRGIKAKGRCGPEIVVSGLCAKCKRAENGESPQERKYRHKSNLISRLEVVSTLIPNEERDLFGDCSVQHAFAVWKAPSGRAQRFGSF